MNLSTIQFAVQTAATSTGLTFIHSGISLSVTHAVEDLFKDVFFDLGMEKKLSQIISISVGFVFSAVVMYLHDPVLFSLNLCPTIGLFAIAFAINLFINEGDFFTTVNCTLFPIAFTGLTGKTAILLSSAYCAISGAKFDFND